jgi:hypothetical protein
MLDNIALTPRQKQVICGTILGGSSIIRPKKGRNCYLSMRCKNPEWLEHKARELQTLASFAPFTREKTFRWHSMCYPVFEEYKNEFYKEQNRFLSLESLNPLQDIGLGVWYGDAGRIKQNKIIMNTHVWGEKGSEVIVEYFSLLGYTPELFCERNCYRVRLDEKSSRHFFSLISHHLPDFLHK